ncbi:protease complex subunit PrcB family protein [archaeon]|nr:protease complex subunit PrcB family protein [archaeon]
MEKELNLESIAKGAVSGHNWAQNYVITDEVSWNNLWRTTYSNTTPMPEMPKIDFSKEMVLAIYLGKKNTGGYSTFVEGVYEYDDRVLVSARETTPQQGRKLLMVLTAPYTIVKTERVNKEVNFDISELD